LGTIRGKGEIERVPDPPFYRGRPEHPPIIRKKYKTSHKSKGLTYTLLKKEALFV
jgi:hypothetical protein